MLNCNVIIINLSHFNFKPSILDPCLVESLKTGKFLPLTRELSIKQANIHEKRPSYDLMFISTKQKSLFFAVFYSDSTINISSVQF